MNQTVKGGRRTFTIYHFTGKVASASKGHETQIHGSGGGGMSYQGTGGTAPVRITSTTVIHDQLFLVDKDGKEKALQLQDFNVACRESNIVTASWAEQIGSEEGAYFAITNHSTGQQFVNDSVIKKIVVSGTGPGMSKYLGCSLIFAIFAVVIYLCVKLPILIIPVVGFVIYMNWVVIPKWVKEFKSGIEYPKVELW